MIRTVLIAINSQYVHSPLAVWYLKAACGTGAGDVIVLESTINDDPDAVLGSIYRLKPDVAAFSCYIWNITFVRRIAANLKKIMPGTIIIFGGPEVSFETGGFINGNPFADLVLSGEGEELFPEIISAINRTGSLDGINYDGGYALINNLDNIPSPYTEAMLSSLQDRITYFESSRGCPFACSYCLSPASRGVRYFPMDRVKNELLKLSNAGVRRVKFVDRTINDNPERAKEIFDFIITSEAAGRLAGGCNYHFEAAPDLFDDEMISILRRAPAGMIQFEIGIQSLNPDTLKSINRKMDKQKASFYIEKLLAQGNIHLHLDLIAGLPFEDECSFRDSFNGVYAIGPHKIQLGSLKMLKGSRIYSEAALHGYCSRDNPPYEVLYNSYIGYDGMSTLKGIAALLDRYYNSCRFERTLAFLTSRLYQSPFDLFKSLNGYLLRRKEMNRDGFVRGFTVNLSSKDLYIQLLDYVKSSYDSKAAHIVRELLRYDFISASRQPCPPGLRRTQGAQGNGVGGAEYSKDTCTETFDYDPFDMQLGLNSPECRTTVMFDFTSKNPVNGRFTSKKLIDN